MSSGDRTPYEVLAVRLGMAGQALTGHCNIEHFELFRLMEKYGKPRGGGMEAALLAAEERIKELEYAEYMSKARGDVLAEINDELRGKNEIAAKSYELMQERIRALEEALREFTQAGVEYGAPRYLTIQVGREQMEAARALLSTAKPIPTNPEKKETP